MNEIVNGCTVFPSGKSGFPRYDAGRQSRCVMFDWLLNPAVKHILQNARDCLSNTNLSVERILFGTLRHSNEVLTGFAGDEHLRLTTLAIRLNEVGERGEGTLVFSEQTPTTIHGVKITTPVIDTDLVARLAEGMNSRRHGLFICLG